MLALLWLTKHYSQTNKIYIHLYASGQMPPDTQLLFRVFVRLFLQYQRHLKDEHITGFLELTQSDQLTLRIFRQFHDIKILVAVSLLTLHLQESNVLGCI